MSREGSREKRNGGGTANVKANEIRPGRIAKAKTRLTKDQTDLQKKPKDVTIEEEIAAEEALMQNLEAEEIPYSKEEVKYDEEEIALYQKFMAETSKNSKEAEELVPVEKLAAKHSHEQVFTAEKVSRKPKPPRPPR